MPKTSHQVCAKALREIEVLGIDQDMPAAYYDDAKMTLEAIYGELQNNRGLVIDWTIETVPDQYFLPLAVVVGAYSARMYGKPVSEAEKQRVMGILRSALVADDREDLRPDGVQKRAAFM